MAFDSLVPDAQAQDIAVQGTTAQSRAHRWRATVLFASTVLLTVALIVFVPIDAVKRLGAYGYLGVFVLTLLSSATIVIPSPALGTAFLAGTALNPWLVGLVAGIAAAIGETTGYVAGYSGSNMATESRFYPRVESWVQQWGFVTVFVLAAVPSPLIDLAGIAAGTLRMRFRAYIIACMAGKTLRFIGVAWLGHMWL